MRFFHHLFKWIHCIWSITLGKKQGLKAINYSSNKIYDKTKSLKFSLTQVPKKKLFNYKYSTILKNKFIWRADLGECAVQTAYMENSSFFNLHIKIPKMYRNTLLLRQTPISLPPPGKRFPDSSMHINKL